MKRAELRSFRESIDVDLRCLAPFAFVPTFYLFRQSWHCIDRTTRGFRNAGDRRCRSMTGALESRLPGSKSLRVARLRRFVSGSTETAAQSSAELGDRRFVENCRVLGLNGREHRTPAAAEPLPAG